MFRMFVILSLFFASPSYAAEQKSTSLRCEFTSKFVCSGASCEQIVSTETHILVDTEKGSYSRCDSRGCDNYKPIISKSGVFTNVALPKNGSVVKIQNDEMSVVDVATIGLHPLVSHGTCKLNQ